MDAATDVMTVYGRSAKGDGSTAHQWCPMERALKDVGTNSALLLLREVFYGARRFDELARKADITEQMAAIRLKQLVEAGILAKQPYQEPGQRTRYEYVLTARGQELFPVMVSLVEFGLLLQGDAKKLQMVHGDGCGAPITARVQCAEGHMVPLSQAEVRIGIEGASTAANTNSKSRSNSRSSTKPKKR
jgi:DNA-binding HxlR family transcriptional regulator